MRYFVFLFLLFNITISQAQYVDVNAVEIPIGYYVSNGSKKTVFVYTSTDTAEVKAIAIVPEFLTDRGRMSVEEKRLVIPYSNDNLERLRRIKDKYSEWSQIAMREKAPKMLKTIDIEIPDMYVLTYKESIDKPRHDDYHITLESRKFDFVVPAKAEMMPMLYFMIKGKDLSRESSYTAGSHEFHSVHEIEEILDLVNPVKLHMRIKNNTIDKLFK